MALKTATEVTAARIVFSSGMEQRLYTVASVSQGDHSDLSLIFEKVYDCKAWIIATGVDAEVYVADEDFAADDLTFNGSGVPYLVVVGVPVTSLGGST